MKGTGVEGKGRRARECLECWLEFAAAKIHKACYGWVNSTVLKITVLLKTVTL